MYLDFVSLVGQLSVNLRWTDLLVEGFEIGTHAKH